MEYVESSGGNLLTAFVISWCYMTLRDYIKVAFNFLLHKTNFTITKLNSCVF